MVLLLFALPLCILLAGPVGLMLRMKISVHTLTLTDSSRVFTFPFTKSGAFTRCVLYIQLLFSYKCALLTNIYSSVLNPFRICPPHTYFI